MSKNLNDIFVACPDQGVGNDPETLGKPFTGTALHSLLNTSWVPILTQTILGVYIFYYLVLSMC